MTNLRRLLAYYKPYIFLIVSDLAAVVIAAVLSMAVPFLLKVIVDSIIPARDSKGMTTVACIIAGMIVFKFFSNFYSIYAGHVLAAKMERDMRRNLFYHLQKLSFRFYDDNKTGELMSRMTNDISKVSDAVNHAPEDIFLSVLSIIGSFVMLYVLHPLLALICFIPIPFMFFYSNFFGKRLLKSFTDINNSMADINAKVENSISGIRVVQSFAREEFEKSNFDKLNSAYYEAWRGSIKNLSGFFGGIFLLRDLSQLIIIVAGGAFIFAGSMSLGTFVAFLFYVGIYLEPIEKLTRTNEMLQRMKAGLKRFYEIMDTEPDVQEKNTAIILSRVEGRITFDHVTFGYDHNKHVFKNLNLIVEPGTTIALVGPSGVGKTTFCSLIPRFYDVNKGRVTIDGIDVQDISLRSLREQIGIVQQDVFLFTGTVKENIAYGKDGVVEEQIIAAAKKANAHEFIMELPEGYSTYIGEKGVKLSGGQKQRIAIARVFLKDPRILIFDEATSSLDTKSEQMIQEILYTLVKGRTTFIIAHRLSTIKHADEIIVLSDNGIEQRGTHDELVAIPGLYASLYTAQYNGIIPDTV